MNDEASCKHGEFRTSEVFQRQYATIVLQLKDVNKQVSTMFIYLNATEFFLHSKSRTITSIAESDLQGCNSWCKPRLLSSPVCFRISKLCF